MTRINVISPELLSDAHLGAEYRELPRIFGLVAKAIARGESPNDSRNPKTYILGAGHVRFFYSNLGFLANRFNELVLECLKRGRVCNFTEVPEIYANIPNEWKNNWTPTEESILINIERINLRGGLRKDKNV